MDLLNFTCSAGPIKSPTTVTQARTDPSTTSTGSVKSHVKLLSSSKSKNKIMTFRHMGCLIAYVSEQLQSLLPLGQDM